MKAEFRKRFLKDLSNIPASQRQAIERFVFEELPKFRSVEEGGKVERMKGYPGFFKVRFGDYRVGLSLLGDTVVFERVLHRKEIYRYFP